MQKRECRYLGEVVAIYKKNGAGKGSRHESLLCFTPQETGTLTNIAVWVFLQAHPEEEENLFWTESKATGCLWTLAMAKNIIYNLGTGALDKGEGRYYQLKGWAFDRKKHMGTHKGHKQTGSEQHKMNLKFMVLWESRNGGRKGPGSGHGQPGIHVLIGTRSGSDSICIRRPRATTHPGQREREREREVTLY
ncbi:hypothetical protein PHLCEN_2v13326 [Hermanssonia centrifuga]|uniref:Uncharacterized protein n=1 Tax=Hermanssonia centrifuga TaxID=98765 RepID=A0A2R6NEK0_9APHY|nr:hypothetical protein PHLCEN_2v13326 [Hermanssonia centrifuga]